MNRLADMWTSGPLQPHAFCLFWDPELMSLFWLGNAGIAFAYFIIPVLLLWGMRDIRRLVPAWAYIEFATFIFFCGISHILDIVVLYHPIYYIQAVWINITAIVSLFTAFTAPVAFLIAVRLRREEMLMSKLETPT